MQSLPTSRLWSAVISTLPADRQLRSIAWLVGGNVLKLGLGLATNIVVFRVLGPEDTGRLTLTLGIVGLVSIVGEFGLRDAAVNYIAHWLPTAPERAASVARAFFASKSVLSLFASAVGITSAGFVAARFYPQARIADMLQLGAVSLFTSGLLGFAMVILQAQQKFAAISLLGVLQSALRLALVMLLFATQSINLFTLLALESILPFAALLYSLRWIPSSFYAWRMADLENLSPLLNFTKWIAVAALASTLFLRLDVLLLSYYRPSVQVGLYAVALALVAKLDVVKSAVLATAFPEACRRTTREDLRTFVIQSLRLTLLASLAFLPLFAIGGYLIEWFYGAAYHDAIPAFVPLLAAFLVGLNAEPTAYVLYPLNRPRWIAASDLIQLAFSVTVNVILIPAYGIVGAAWGVLLTRMAAALITLALVRRFLW